MPNHKLSIALINFSGLSAWAKGDYLAYPTEGYTNENGAFELEYQHDKKALHMQVFSESAGMLITTAANIDHERDLCFKGFAYLKINFKGLNLLGEKDTIYLNIGGLKAVTHIKARIFSSNNDSSVNIIPYPFDDIEGLKNLTIPWNREANASTSMSWQINNFRNDYLDNKIFNLSFEGFPYKNEYVIDVSK